jgi:hypothetical protein
MMRRFASGAAFAVVVLVCGGSVSAGAQSSLRQVVAQHLRARGVSQGVREWLNPPKFTPGAVSHLGSNSLSFGTNVDAADPQEDLASGQSETAIDASASGRVMVAWNDISALASFQGNGLQASFTGVGYSADGGQSFTDLVGLANPNPDQQWNGDPAVVSIDGGAHFIVGSLFFPSLVGCSDGKPAQLTVAVEVLTPTATGVTMGKPVVASKSGNVCQLGANKPPPNIALLDKDFLAWDPSSRTLAVSFTRFFLSGNHTGSGQIDLARAHVPVNATQLKSSDFHTAVVWPEEQTAENEGAYPALAPGGNAYVAWERNWISNLFASGDPHVYEHIAFVPADANTPAAGGKNDPVVVTKGQGNATPVGGVKSLDSTSIAGYSRGIGNDFPRIAWNRTNNRVVVAWNDASLHPLGDIWLRSYSSTLSNPSAIARVNDDSDFALHFMPAVSVRSNGRICTSWYDRRLFGPDSAHTDYFGDCRPSVGSSRTDFRITTGATDWANTSSLINPNFGDYTDNASVGTTTYYTWSDGRIGVPQPFTDHN